MRKTMKLKIAIPVLVVLGLTSATLPVIAQTAAQITGAQSGTQLPWSSLDGLAASAKEHVEITLDSNTLKLVNGLSGGLSGGDKAGSQAEKLLSTLKAITVRAYEFRNPGAYDMRVLLPFRERLLQQGWTKMLDLKDDSETFELYSKSEQGKNVGFAMIAAEPKELAIIHIDGPIDLSQLGSLGGQFGIPKLPPVGQQKGKE